MLSSTCIIIIAAWLVAAAALVLRQKGGMDVISITTNTHKVEAQKEHDIVAPHLLVLLLVVVDSLFR